MAERARGWRRWPVLSLRARLALALGALVAVLLGLWAAFDLGQRNEQRLQALRLRAEQVAEALVAAVAWPLWEYDDDAAHTALQGVRRDPALVRVVVRDHAGVVLAALQGEPAAGGPPPPDGEAPLVVTRPVVFVSPAGDRRQIGTVELALGRRELAAQLRRDVLHRALELAVVLAALALGIRFATGLFTRPLEAMTRIMQRRAAGDLGGEVDPRWLARDDEIGAIARSLELDQQQRRDEAQLLAITAQISSGIDLGAFLSRLAAAATELLDADRSTIYLYDPARGVLWSQVGEGLDSLRITLRPGQGLAGTAFATGTIVNIPDAHADPRFDRSFDE